MDILVENMGRINYGPLLRDAKGITEGVRIDNQFQYGWTVRTLPLDPDALVALEYKGSEGQAEGAAGEPGLPGKGTTSWFCLNCTGVLKMARFR
ncbi:hypothetical protein D3C76_1353320 [compost metagenome]